LRSLQTERDLLQSQTNLLKQECSETYNRARQQSAYEANFLMASSRQVFDQQLKAQSSEQNSRLLGFEAFTRNELSQYEIGACLQQGRLKTELVEAQTSKDVNLVNELTSALRAGTNMQNEIMAQSAKFATSELNMVQLCSQDAQRLESRCRDEMSSQIQNMEAQAKDKEARLEHQANQQINYVISESRTAMHEVMQEQSARVDAMHVATQARESETRESLKVSLQQNAKLLADLMEVNRTAEARHSEQKELLEKTLATSGRDREEIMKSARAIKDQRNKLMAQRAEIERLKNADPSQLWWENEADIEAAPRRGANSSTRQRTPSGEPRVEHFGAAPITEGLTGHQPLSRPSLCPGGSRFTQYLLLPRLAHHRHRPCLVDSLRSQS